MKIERGRKALLATFRRLRLSRKVGVDISSTWLSEIKPHSCLSSFLAGVTGKAPGSPRWACTTVSQEDDEAVDDMLKVPLERKRKLSKHCRRIQERLGSILSGQVTEENIIFTVT